MLSVPAVYVLSSLHIMEQFRIFGGAMLRYPNPTDVVNLIRPDGTNSHR